MRFENQQQLDASVAYWQKLLRLQDWKVTARLMRNYDMGRAMGTNHIHWDDKSCCIEINDKLEYGLEPHDQEHTLVHELVHLLTRPILLHFASDPRNDDDGEVTVEEQAVNLLASALIAPNRRA